MFFLSLGSRSNTTLPDCPAWKQPPYPPAITYPLFVSSQFYLQTYSVCGSSLRGSTLEEIIYTTLGPPHTVILFDISCQTYLQLPPYPSPAQPTSHTYCFASLPGSFSLLIYLSILIPNKFILYAAASASSGGFCWQPQHS